MQTRANGKIIGPHWRPFGQLLKDADERCEECTDLMLLPPCGWSRPLCQRPPSSPALVFFLFLSLWFASLGRPQGGRHTVPVGGATGGGDGPSHHRPFGLHPPGSSDVTPTHTKKRPPGGRSARTLVAVSSSQQLIFIEMFLDNLIKSQVVQCQLESFKFNLNF